ncbi:MAG: hypothetical protein ACRDC6_20120 [Shewanella sp.]
MLGDGSLNDAIMQLSKKVDEIINDSSNLNNNQISDGYFKNHVPVADFFDSVFIDHRIIRLIDIINSESNEHNQTKNPTWTKNTSVSIGDFLRKYKRIQKAKDITLRAIKLFKMHRFDNSMLQNWNGSSEKDYLEGFYILLGDIKNFTKSSKKIKRKTYDYTPDLCAFCWRLVNKVEFIGDSKRESESQKIEEGRVRGHYYSKHYCFEHHPKRKNSKYHHAKYSLLSAIKKLDYNFGNFLPVPGENNEITPDLFYSATARFVKKVHIINSKENEHEVSDWRERANLIKETANKYYHNAFLQIQNVNVNDFKSWKDWFYAVIQSLDSPIKSDYQKVSSEEKDASTWDSTFTEWEKKQNADAVASDSIGEDVLLNILHRFECVSKINSVPQPRGPQKGTVKKNDVLRETLMQLANEKIENGMKINGSQIARDLGISRQRVSKLLKEMGVR